MVFRPFRSRGERANARINRRSPYSIYHRRVLRGVHTLDFGFLEHIYKEALAKELRDRGHHVDREVRVIVYYKSEPIAVQIIDMVVDGKVVVEVKASAEVRAAWGRQLQNYLRATDLEVGLLLHFGLEAKFHRVVELRSRKVRRSKLETDSTDLTDFTDRSVSDESSTSRER